MVYMHCSLSVDTIGIQTLHHHYIIGIQTLHYTCVRIALGDVCMKLSKHYTIQTLYHLQ